MSKGLAENCLPELVPLQVLKERLALTGFSDRTDLDKTSIEMLVEQRS